MYVLDDDTRRFGRLLHYTGVLAAVVCGTATYTMLYAPVVANVVETESQINEVMLSVQNAPMIREHHEKVSEQWEVTNRRIAEVRRRVPSEADAGMFLKEITRIAERQKLTIKDFQPHKPVGKNGYMEMEVTLSGQGSYVSICSFFDRLAKLKRLSKVKKLRVSTSAGLAEYPLEATLVIYFGLQDDVAVTLQEVHRG